MHALQKLFAKAIHHRVVRAHSLLHDFWCDTDHVRVANVPALDNSHDILAGTELAGHRLHAKNSRIGAAKRVENQLRRASEWTWREIFEKKSFANGIAFRQRHRQARRNRLAGKVGDQCDALVRQNRQAGIYGIARAGQKLGLDWSKIHRDIVNRLAHFCYWIEHWANSREA